ncbi:MAG: ATP-binding cassette domain-containing protein [Bacteroidales bacterium]|nr:ATP-binding cassette domain-containing protein [Bacteroidales bacterium]
MSSNSENTLLADSIRLSFGSQDVLNGAWLRSQTGKVTGVLGRNGCGKSCMFRSIMGELRPQDMFVRINDRIVTGSMEMGHYIKYLSQKPFLPPKMKLNEVFDFFEADFDAFIRDFPQFGQYRETRINELSGGEVRIAEIWLCLCSKSPFCILDEPFSYLAPVAIEVVQKLIQREKSNKGIIISDHNYEPLLEIADEVLLLSDGYMHIAKERSDLVRYGYCRG